MTTAVTPTVAPATPMRSRSEVIAFVVMVVLLLIAPLFVYPLFLMKALCFALFACAFNLLLGYVGLLSFGHALYFGWASYVSAYAAKAWGFNPEFAILAGALTATVLGLIAGSLAIRRQGIYFAMITLALAQMMYFFAVQAPFTGGEDGIQAVPRGFLFGFIDLQQADEHVRAGAGHFPGRLPDDLPHHPFAVRRSAEGDPRKRNPGDLARLQDRPLQAGGLRAVGRALPVSPAAPRRSCSSWPRSPTWTGRCRARWC